MASSLVIQLGVPSCSSLASEIQTRKPRVSESFNCKQLSHSTSTHDQRRRILSGSALPASTASCVTRIHCSRASSNAGKTSEHQGFRLIDVGFSEINGRQRARPLPATTQPASVTTPSVEKGEPGKPPYTVVITGSTKGVGYALALEFLAAGDRVAICSRDAARVEDVVEQLQAKFDPERVWGLSCDVSDAASVETFANEAVKQFGRIDLWINNAGSNAYTYKPLVETDDAAIEEIVKTNSLGVMLCCRQAIRVMRSQPGGGHIFNMDGAGADGNATPRFAVYGATKRSLAQFTKSMQAELKMLDINNVTVHNLSPGMVTTELLMSGATTRSAKFFINALAEPAEEVAKYLVPRIREIPGANSRKSTYIRFLTSTKAYTQIILRIIFKARMNRYVKED